MSTSTRSPAGVFRFCRATGAWSFPEPAARVYGLRPDDGPPSADLVLSRVHPDDRPALEQLWAATLAGGEPGSVWHRVCGTRGEVRHVVTSLSGEYDGDGVLEAAVGHVVDVSDALRRTSARVVDDALAQISRSRPLIEQAKGALMALYGLGPDDAFALLRAHSQGENVKLREVARTLVDALATTGDLPAGSRPVWDRLAADFGRVHAVEEAEQNPGA